MKFKDIANLSEADRNKKVVEAKAELIKLNGQVATGTAPKSPGRINQLKKLLARVLTLENQQKMEAENASKVDSSKFVKTVEKK